MNRLLMVQLAALALILFGGNRAEAAPIPASSLSWNYNFSASPMAIYADDAVSFVQLTNEPTGTAVGTSDIVATNIKVFSAAPVGSPAQLGSGGAYSLTLVISALDNGTPYSASLTFTGKLGGSFSQGAANVTNTFTSATTDFVDLGNYTFTVTIGNYTPPGPPSATNQGSISAHVTVSSATGGGIDSPEPSTMLLSGLGLTFLGGAAWRKRRQQRMATAA